MTSEFEARFVWANSDGKKVYVAFILCPLEEQESQESSIDCRVDRFVEYRTYDGDNIFDQSELPEQIRQQVEMLLGTKRTILEGVRSGAILYIEPPSAPSSELDK